MWKIITKIKIFNEFSCKIAKILYRYELLGYMNNNNTEMGKNIGVYTVFEKGFLVSGFPFLL